MHYTNSDDSNTSQTGSLYWRMEEMIKRLESDTGSTMGADGSLFAIRRVLYPSVPPNLLDDMIASINPIFSGFRVISAQDVHAFERATVDSGDELRRKRRIACRAFNTHRFLRPRLRKMSLKNRFKYASHKYLRWISAVFFVLWIILSLGAIAIVGGVTAALVAAVVVLGLALLGRAFAIPIVSAMIEMALSILATGLGVAEALAGRNYQTWAPVRDRRA